MRIAAIVLLLVALASPALAHGGGLNACGCHIDHKTGDCHCHRPSGCGCACQPEACSSQPKIDALDVAPLVAPPGPRPA